MDIDRISVRPNIFKNPHAVCINQASPSMIVGRKL